MNESDTRLQNKRGENTPTDHQRVNKVRYILVECGFCITFALQNYNIVGNIGA